MPETKDVRRIQRTATKEVSRMLLSALRDGHRYKMTRSGIIIYGPDGIAGTHLCGSDHRRVQNFRADLRRAGITIEKGK